MAAPEGFMEGISQVVNQLIVFLSLIWLREFFPFMLLSWVCVAGYRFRGVKCRAAFFVTKLESPCLPLETRTRTWLVTMALTSPSDQLFPPPALHRLSFSRSSFPRSSQNRNLGLGGVASAWNRPAWVWEEGWGHCWVAGFSPVTNFTRRVRVDVGSWG